LGFRFSLLEIIRDADLQEKATEVAKFDWTKPQTPCKMRIGFQIYKMFYKRTSLVDLKLNNLYVIFPGNISFPLTKQMTACGLNAFPIRD